MREYENERTAELESAMQQAVSDLDQISADQKTLVDIHVETTRLLQGMMEIQRQALARLTG